VKRVSDGRILIIHEAGGTRAQMTDLLAREGFSVEAVESTYRGMARFVEDPAFLVILGLAGLRENELELIPALKQEPRPPKILVAFPASLRELAVRALEAGADAYVLEPFYAAEFVRLSAAHAHAVGPERGAAGAPDLARLAAEVAHAVNNPLQILSLLLADEKLPKKQLAERAAEELERIRAVVRHLSAFGAAAPPEPRRLDLRALLAQAAAEESLADRLTIAPGPRIDARGDERNVLAALRALLAALAARVAPDQKLSATLEPERGGVHLTLEAPAAGFQGERVEELPDSVFVVREDRRVAPGLALARTLLRAQQGALEASSGRERASFTVRLPRA
jgi:CheY-like chemotaxis protein